MLHDYFINFWIWWYFVKVPEWGEALLRRLAFVLQYTNTLVMAQNLTVPLFQDNTGVGKLLSFIIRALWVWVGGMISAVMALPLVALWVGQVILPPLLIVMLIKGLLNIL